MAVDDVHMPTCQASTASAHPREVTRAQLQGISSVLGDGRLDLSVAEIDAALGPIGAAHAAESGTQGAARWYAGLVPIWREKRSIEPLLPVIRTAIRTIRDRGPSGHAALERCVRQLNLVLRGASYTIDHRGYLTYATGGVDAAAQAPAITRSSV